MKWTIKMKNTRPTYSSECQQQKMEIARKISESSLDKSTFSSVHNKALKEIQSSGNKKSGLEAVTKQERLQPVLKKSMEMEHVNQSFLQCCS